MCRKCGLLWWFEEDYFDGRVIGRKNEFNWTMMIRQPETVIRHPIAGI